MNTVDSLKNLYKTMAGTDWPYDPNPTDAEVIDKIAEDSTGGGGGGVTPAIKDALLQIAQKVAYVDGNGATYYQALYDALNDEPTPEPEMVSVGYNLSHVTSSNTATKVEKGTAYRATLTAASGYTLSTVTVTMGGTNVTSSVYSNGVVNIPAVTGNVVISATAIVPAPQTATVTYNLTNVTSSNTAGTVQKNAAYNTTLTAASGYTLSTVTVTMGGTNVTSSVYSDGTVNISSVTGNIVITATAAEAGGDPVPVSLTATYTPVSGETITTATPHSRIKKRLTTTVTYSDNTTTTLLPAQYELTGDFVAGTTTLTASYGDLTTNVSIPSVASSTYWKVIDIQEDMYDGVGLAASPANTKTIAGYGVAIGAKTNSRVSYVDWDLPLDNAYTYTYDYDRNEGSELQIGVPRYKEAPLASAPADIGWINPGTVVNINADHSNYNKAVRLTISDTLANALAGGMTTIRITRTAVS